MELNIEQTLQHGIEAHKKGNLQEAERLYRAILQSEPAHPHANHNLGVIAVSVAKTKLALPLFKTALEANPKIEQFWLSYIDTLIKENQFEMAKNILVDGRKMGLVGGNFDALDAQLKQITQSALSKFTEKKKSLTLKQKRKKVSETKQQKKEKKTKTINGVSPSQSQLNNLLDLYQNKQYIDAEKLALSITQQFPEDEFGWKVLGEVFRQTGRTSKALNANQRAVKLAPKDAEAYNNLGTTLQEMHRFEEAGASYRQALSLRSDFAEAHSNLGITLKDLGRLVEAEASSRQAIALEPAFAAAHHNLGITLYIKGNIDAALKSMEKAHHFDPKSWNHRLLVNIIKSRKLHEKSEVSFGGVRDSVFDMRLSSNPLILHRTVEPELVANLYDINTRELDETNDDRFGNGITTDYSLFENKDFIMGAVVEDLMAVIKEAVKSDVIIANSFFNIFRTGSGITPHRHLSPLDIIKGIDLYKQKYVLQYYLRVGDQTCSEPGVYKLYEPDEEILPSEGMIIIIPAERMHSAVYGGKKDRVMIGVNFYVL